MNQLNWTHKKRLNHYGTTFSILPSVLTAPLNQIYRAGISSSFGLPRILKEIWHHKQPQSGTKAKNAVLLIKSNKKGLARTERGAAIRACLISGACLTTATDCRYLFRQGTDKKIQIIRYRQPGAVFRKEPVDKYRKIDRLLVYV